MNDAELDRLIAATAPASDAGARTWDVAGPEADLLEELLSTIETPDRAAAADGTGTGTGIGAGPERPGTDLPALPTPPPAARGPRRRVAALAVAAAVAATVGAVALLAPDDGSPVTSEHGPAAPGSAQSPGSTGLRPADLGAPAAPEDVAAAEALPRLADPTGTWDIVRVDTYDPDWGDAEFTDGQGSFDVTWYPAGEYEDRFGQVSESNREGVDVTVAGAPALRFDYGEVTIGCPENEVCTTDPTVPGGGSEASASSTTTVAGGEVAHDYTTVLVLGDHTLEFRGVFPTAEAYDAAVGSVAQLPAADWLALVPDSVVTPSRRGATVDEMLAGVPLPPGLDAASLRSGPAFRSRYQEGAAVTGAVACGWIGSWVDAKAAGDTASVQAAVDAMAGTHDWAILNEMLAEGAWSEVLWEYADALPTDAPVSGGRPLTIAESYDEALGCNA